jgi:cell division protein FtsZ
VQGARGVLLNITGGPSLSLHEVDEASSIIKEAADPDANIIVGQVINPDLGDELIITVVATGFDRDEPAFMAPALEQSKAKPVRTPQPAVTAARLASADVSSQNLERPAFLRRMNGQTEAQERLGLALDDEWDVPTFLRKQVD